jgi:serine/threonine-protein kinase
VIARALAKAPADRYPSAGDLGRAARAAVAGERVSTARGSVATGAATPEEAEPTRIAPAPGATAVMAPEAATALAAEPAAAGNGGPPRDQRRPAAVKVQRGRGRKLALAATVAVLALPTILAVRWIAGADGTPTGPLSAGEVRDAAESFADAYSNEDDAALRRTLTPAVRRWGASGAAQRGRAAVVGEYHRQFATSKVQHYALDDLKVAGGRAGRAEGRYTVTRGGAPPITGRIVFGVIRRDGKAAIDLIATEPRP